MPVYEYECVKCGYRFEFFKRNSEKEPDACPKCKGSLKRVISGGVGFVFKGSGFYITDYKRKEDKKSEEKSKSSCSTCSGGNCSTCK